MANRTRFEDLSDDLACTVLEKLSRPGLKRAFDGMVALASFACVSPRYARLVKEHAWEGACRKVAPEACTRLAPLRGSEYSPGGAGWASFAKLLVWCPGFRVGTKDQREGAHAELGTDGGPKSKYVESQMCRDDGASVEVSSDELIFADASECDARYVLRCSAHHETLDDDLLDDSYEDSYIQRLSYDNFERMVHCGSYTLAQAGNAAMPLTIVRREGSVGPRSVQGKTFVRSALRQYD
jgi:hypothetical protein